MFPDSYCESRYYRGKRGRTDVSQKLAKKICVLYTQYTILRSRLASKDVITQFLGGRGRGGEEVLSQMRIFGLYFLLNTYF